MQADCPDHLRHAHGFLGSEHARNERRAWAVVAVSLLAMGLEIAAGLAFGSLGLLAEGVHMAAHAGVMAAAGAAYLYARRHVSDRRFSFGVGKVGDLTAFASALALGAVALALAGESVQRLARPETEAFGEALVVGVVGLVISIASAALLHSSHAHGAAERHADLNIRAAYLHFLGDVIVSVLAIAGLAAGRWLGWLWADPLAGLAGAAVVARFALGLGRRAAGALVDVTPDPALADEIARRMRAAGAVVYDLHLWRVGPGHDGLILGLHTAEPRAPAWYKARLADLGSLSHITVEVTAAASADAPAPPATTGPPARVVDEPALG